MVPLHKEQDESHQDEGQRKKKDHDSQAIVIRSSCGRSRGLMMGLSDFSNGISVGP